MRRADKAIHDRQVIDAILAGNTVCRLGMIDNGIPYVLPMNYGYENGIVYLHSAQEGRKIDILEKNSAVCLEVSDNIGLVRAGAACSHSMEYRTVLGWGKAVFLDAIDEKRYGLQVIMRQLTGDDGWDLPGKSVDCVSVIRVKLETVSGKSSRKQASHR